jgi:predicted nucleic acid-binding Zn finger protein
VDQRNPQRKEKKFMTAKEMQKRNERAQQLRVIQVDDTNFFVESADGKIAYKAVVSDEREFCSCPDYLKNAPGDPNFRCKHLLAILNCVPEDAEKKSFLEKRKPKLDERFIKNIEGRDFCLYAGLLDLAHQKGIISIETEILQFPTKENGDQAIVKAMVESKLGECFSDIGDADPTNCNSKVVKHLLRMASTRSKARALRDFTNIGMTCLEELGDLNEVIGEDNPKTTGTKTTTSKRVKHPEASKNNGGPQKAEHPTSAKTQAQAPDKKNNQNQSTSTTTTGPEPKMSEAQRRAVYNLSRRRGISVDELQKMVMEAYGVSLDGLSAADASKFIRQLQMSA